MQNKNKKMPTEQYRNDGFNIMDLLLPTDGEGI